MAPGKPALAGALALLACACSGGQPIVGCDDEPGIRVVCGLRNPEDLALLDDGRSVVVSQFGGGSMDGATTGSLAFYDARTGSLGVAYPTSGSASFRGDSTWGDPSCPGPPGAAISPHGIDVAGRPDGRTSLLVVNHGGRESVELFEVLWSGTEARLEWRGCALAPEGALLNDGVHLPGGGFLVTRMLDRGDEMWGMLRATLGRETGRVYEWQPGTGFRPVPGSRGPLPNGIEVSADGAEIYLNLYSAGEVRRIARDSGRILATGRVKNPDNSSWASDGRLLVASHTGGILEQMACMRLREGACGMAFEIVALDPHSLEGEAIFTNAGSPMGGATIAIEVDGDLLMGSFAGDRLIRARPGGP